jgi:osmoprotectant transport system permease protein
MRWLSRNWDDLLWATWDHAVLTAVSLGIAFALALAVGIAVRRRRRAYAAALGLAELVYTIPALALFALLIPLVGLGRVPAVIGLASYAFFILLRNTVTGIRAVPADVVESAVGMGFSPRQVLTRIELPLALPAIVAGLRVAAVTVIGAGTVAAYINAGGLGEVIFAGIYQTFPVKIFAGAAAASLLAVLTDTALARLERALRRGG